MLSVIKIQKFISLVVSLDEDSPIGPNNEDSIEKIASADVSVSTHVLINAGVKTLPAASFRREELKNKIKLKSELSKLPLFHPDIYRERQGRFWKRILE